MRAKDIPEINKLSIAEKILLIEELWESIVRDEANVSVPQSHIDELERRLRRYEANSGNLLSLEELQERLETKK